MRLGQCLCGSVSYEVEGEPVIALHCHCVDCQRLSGAGHTTGAMFPADKVVILGALSEFELDSENESVVTRSFCPKCGSQLFGQNSKMPGYLTISAGTLDDPNSVTPEAIVFVRTRRHWDMIDGALPAFETQPDWRPEDESKGGES